MALPHFGQWEAGKTMDFPSGIRQMQTLRKLPIMAPKTNATMFRNIGIILSAGVLVSRSKNRQFKNGRMQGPRSPED
jgi:hypothetical protein